MVFCLLGKSNTGKDTLYRRLLEEKELGLRPLALYTTRPIRENETDGEHYHFVSEQDWPRLKQHYRTIEEREYHTVEGLWRYATLDDGNIPKKNILVIATPASLESYRKAWHEVVPLYVEVDDGIRLSRAVKRELSQKSPNYKELCRRFLADEEDFSAEALKNCKIEKKFINHELEACLNELKREIRRAI